MNYEERYNQALKVIESLYNVVRYQSSTDALFASQTIEKAFPELKESEDERIRKELINYLKKQAHSGFNQEVRICNDGIAWLEKQGEHEKFRKKIQIGDQVTRNQDGELVNLSQLKRVAKSSEKQKPIGWSEEDEKHLKTALLALNDHPLNFEELATFDWLKSLKPQARWKPSEDQMVALKCVLPEDEGESEIGDILKSLYDELKKL